nr:phosphoribosyltransferase domain-containing protein [Rappaport israeli]
MQQTHHLPTGTLQLNIHHSELPPDALFGIGARDNPKRAFLFVSKVLGKHYPVGTETLGHIYQSLAAKLPAPEDKITLFIGMAETATALAQGVFEAWLKRYPQAQALYLHSSRLRAQGHALCEFEESHSHASRQLLHLPASPRLSALFQQAQRLVLIDDELSTGRTFQQLHQALQRHLPQPLEQHWLCLTDFCRQGTPDIQRHSLLQGDWHFTPHPSIADTAPAAAAQSQEAPQIIDSGCGRTGIDRPLHINPEQIAHYAAAHRSGERVLVLGTGEYIHPAALFAQGLAAQSAARFFCNPAPARPRKSGTSCNTNAPLPTLMTRASPITSTISPPPIAMIASISAMSMRQIRRLAPVPQNWARNSSDWNSYEQHHFIYRFRRHSV